MVKEIKLSKFDESPWGFRLIGGADFEIPLTVLKVTEGSLAEQAGMNEGDIIVRINNTAVSKLTHREAHDILREVGNTFFLGVISAHDDHLLPPQPPHPPTPSPVNFIPIREGSPSILIQAPNDEIIEVINPEMDDVDHQIAELMSGETEVLKDHNVLGVNFQKIMPKSGLIKCSEVFQHINADAIKTKGEWENEQRKWSTFLQTPNRPVPRTKADEEAEKIIPYQVRIFKQPKPKVDPTYRAPTPPPPTPIPPQFELVPEPAPQYVEYLSDSAVEENDNPPEDSEVPDLTGENVVVDSIEIVEEEIEEIFEPRAKTPEIKKSPEEMYLEQQLLAVQKQLLELSNLPFAIQATLDAVTAQLSLLVPAIKQQQNLEINHNRSPEPVEVSSCDEGHTEEMISIHEDQPSEELIEDVEEKIISEEENVVDTEPEITAEDLEAMRIEEERQQLEAEWEHKKQKDLEEEHHQRLIKERTLKRPPSNSKRSFFPLVPLERPIVLPGGRKWRNAKDAFNEEFIAEVLSSQAELIIGSTLGHTYESPLLGYDQRVNFLKYQKPEKKINTNSDVFRIVHNMDKEPKQGIAARPEKIMAEEDIRSHTAPVACGP